MARNPHVESAPQQQEHASEKHDAREHLPHAERTSDKPELHIRLACELQQKAQRGVADEKGASQQSGSRARAPSISAVEHPEGNCQQDAFGERLIELRRMSRDLERVRRKDHCPWDAARSAVELTVNEVPDAAEKKTGSAAERHRG